MHCCSLAPQHHPKVHRLTYIRVYQLGNCSCTGWRNNYVSTVNMQRGRACVHGALWKILLEAQTNSGGSVSNQAAQARFLQSPIQEVIWSSHSHPSSAEHFIAGRFQFSTLALGRNVRGTRCAASVEAYIKLEYSSGCSFLAF